MDVDRAAADAGHSRAFAYARGFETNRPSCYITSIIIMGLSSWQAIARVYARSWAAPKS